MGEMKEFQTGHGVTEQRSHDTGSLRALDGKRIDVGFLGADIKSTSNNQPFHI